MLASFLCVLAPWREIKSLPEGAKIYQGTNLSFTHKNLTPGTYYYTVYARDKAGNISKEVPAQATVE
jgi:hypothetical protein